MAGVGCIEEFGIPGYVRAIQYNYTAAIRHANAAPSAAMAALRGAPEWSYTHSMMSFAPRSKPYGIPRYVRVELMRVHLGQGMHRRAVIAASSWP